MNKFVQLFIKSKFVQIMFLIDPGWEGSFQQSYSNGHKDLTTITCSGSMTWGHFQATQDKLLKANDEGVPHPDSRYQGWFYRPWNREPAWEYFRFLPDGRLEVHHFCTDGCSAISPLGSSNFCCSSISAKGSRCPWMKNWLSG